MTDKIICETYNTLARDCSSKLDTPLAVQIIIDGVDVSGCDFLAKEDIYSSYSGEYQAYKGECGCSENEMCKDHKNCGYKKLAKQLTRKTEECEKLEEKLDITSRQYEALQKKYCEVLKLAKENADSYEHCLKGLED